MLDKGYHISYDSSKEDMFIMTKDDGRVIIFQGSPEGLYYYKPSEKYKQDLRDLSREQKISS